MHSVHIVDETVTNYLQLQEPISRGRGTGVQTDKTNDKTNPNEPFLEVKLYLIIWQSG